MDQNIYKLVYKVTHAGGSGSCFYLKAYDLFVTNYHVVSGFHSVALHDNDRRPYLARVVLVNPSLDIALLAAEGDFSHLPDLNLASDDSLEIGGKVSVAGYPYGMPFTVTEGSVSSPKQLVDGKYYIQTDAAVNPGNSGGPIFNERNEVVGVTVSKLNNADNMGFGIRVEALRKLLDSAGGIDRSCFQVQCDSCDELIAGEEDYCPSCGEKLPEGIFAEHEPSPLAVFCEQAIGEMGVNPVLDKNVIRLNFPPLSGDRRKEFAKQAKAYCEDSKVAIRNIRKDLIAKVKRSEEFSEDMEKRIDTEIQKQHDEHIKAIDAIYKAKEKELLSM